uniref:Uncharacterized protein AlNc14C23G2359 n=1 Tax=Albugo laibachii Nc14 TaxID=890382 RepID=F0W660_9STRA|nr:conserved hypothetical protein [Albugo laibachii Nc14]|eukprot:CCA16602.1 conserved hypothetical protein [Albugo laibachii Nc14]
MESTPRSNFVAFEDLENAPKRSQSRQVRHTNSCRPSDSTNTRASIEPLTSADAKSVILRANAPPKYSGSFEDIMNQIRAKNYTNQQFQRIQEQTAMNRNTLSFSNVSPFFYEASYLQVAQETSLNRVRICFGVGFIALLLYYSFEFSRGAWSPYSMEGVSVGRNPSDQTLILIGTFGLILPSFLVGILLTFVPFGRRNLENITAIVFFIVGVLMIVKKPIEKSKGPVIPLLILLIPVFGITRMRFVRSCLVGWSFIVLYLCIMCVSRNLVPARRTFDTYTDILYQTINYGISVIGGMVSQYRQELLRRRNFCLQLPFSGTLDSDVIEAIKTDKFSRHSLMKTWNLEFRDVEVEESFYRHWYLIDPFPYENPNAGSLHQRVFTTIRFAVLTLSLTQAVLLLQDVKFLKIMRDEAIDPSDFTYALLLRFGITVPLYLCSALFMYILGKSFYHKWVTEAEEAKNAALGRVCAVDVDDSAGEKTYGSIRMKVVVNTVQIRNATQNRILDLLINKGGYVRSSQVFCSMVIACHVACMGSILLIVSSTNQTLPAGVSKGKPKPVYFMGFLNAVLFAHRSGFRVRFIYATYTTLLVGVGIVIAAIIDANSVWIEYAGFMVVILVLGMMISYEEEHLRRSFFILKSIRILEFEEWFTVVLRIQGWVKENIRKKLQNVRRKAQKEHPEMEVEVVNTSMQMTQAAKFGMYAQLVNLAVGIIDLVTS